MRPMRSRTVAVFLPLLAVLLPAAPAAAEPTVALDRTDAVDDVQVFAGGRHLPRQRVESIDLEGAWATLLDDGSARFSVRIADVVDRGVRWEQVVTFRAEHEEGEPWSGIAFSHKPGQGGTAYSEATAEWCDLEVVRRPARDVLAATVPAACLPVGDWKVRVTTETGHYTPGNLGASFQRSRDERRLGRWPAPE